MIKKIELLEPDSCLNKADDNERLFILLARDCAAPETIRFWIEERIRLGKNDRNDPQIVEAELCAQLMIAEREESNLRKNVNLNYFEPGESTLRNWRDTMTT